MLLIILTGTLLFDSSQGYCRPLDSYEKQDLFFKCVRNLDNADQNADDLLDPDEHEIFVKSLTFSLYVVPPISRKEPLPDGLQHDLFVRLVQISGNVVDENGQPRIDIFGADVHDLSVIGEKRIEELHEICDETVQALKDYEPETAAPKMMVMDHVKEKNDQVEEKQEFDDFKQLLSIHSSFIIANFEGWESTDVDITVDSELYNSYMDFLYNLMATQCPQHTDNYKECWDDPYASYDSAYDSESGTLCGSHAEWVRRIFCRGKQRRNLDQEEEQDDNEPVHVIENVVLYRIQDSRCPIPMMSQGKGGGHAPICQTIYGHYLLRLEELDVVHKAQLEEVYVNVTQAAIDNGMLQDSLDSIDRDSVYLVEGAGPRVQPTVHKHHPFHTRRLKDKPCIRRNLLLRSRRGLQESN